MKKVIFSVLSVAILGGAISACGKSTKGKMSNEWKIERWETTSSETDSDGDAYSSSTIAEGSTIKTVDTDSPNGQSSTSETTTGTWNEGTFTIEKDGTYKKTIDYSFSEVNGPSTTTNKTRMEESGTWTFVGKSKGEEFKKNERVIFNTLKSTNTYVQTTTIPNVPATTTTDSETSTYSAGEIVSIYTVTESKSKALELTSESKNSYTYGPNNLTSNSTGTEKINLTAK